MNMTTVTIKAMLAFFAGANVVRVATSHGTMVTPVPRQPESTYWYQAGCMIGCECSGGGKEMYPTPQSVGCQAPAEPTLPVEYRTWNVGGGGGGVSEASVRGDWNRHMPWRSPGSAVPIDPCGIASGFYPDVEEAKYAHRFSSSPGVAPGMRGTDLPPGPEAVWVAGATVEAGFHLTVNHGGGYQYRVCRKDADSDSDLDEDCFARSPLAFADREHTVIFHDGDGLSAIRRNATIGAVDVSGGGIVRPPGSAWRRLPVPACACDIGDGCATDGAADEWSAYDDPLGPSHGECAAGLQFDAPHLSDGTWPEGYGYNPGRSDASGMGDGDYDLMTSEELCERHTSEGNRESCESVPDCKWYASTPYSSKKSTCYYAALAGPDAAEEEMCAQLAAGGTKEKCESFPGCKWHPSVDPDESICYYPGKGKGEDEKEGRRKCSSNTDLLSCEQAAASGSPCAWYDGDKNGVKKRVCYDTTAKDKQISKKNPGSGSYDWIIVDRLVAPDEAGEYILQWRWDAEQTPQIWTTCADVRVVDKNTIAEDAVGASNPARLGVAGAAAVFVFNVFLAAFVSSW